METVRLFFHPILFPDCITLYLYTLLLHRDITECASVVGGRGQFGILLYDYYVYGGRIQYPRYCTNAEGYNNRKSKPNSRQ